MSSTYTTPYTRLWLLSKKWPLWIVRSGGRSKAMDSGEIAVNGEVTIIAYASKFPSFGQHSYHFEIEHRRIDKRCKVTINTFCPWEELNDGERNIYLTELTDKAILGLKRLIPEQDRWWQNDSTI
jgi:hypothetical protein